MADGDPLLDSSDRFSESFKRLAMSFNIIACMIYIWDYILLFSVEVDLVWEPKWSFMKGLYLFQRYLPFIDVILFFYYATAMNLTRTVCRSISLSGGVLTSLGFAASEMILTLRTWAVWNRNRRLAIILSIFFTLTQGLSFAITGIYLNSIQYGDPYPGFTGCLPTKAHKYDLVFLSVLTTTWDTLMLILMLVPAVRAFRFGGNSALINTVYRDGVIYYLYTFVLSSINVFVLAILPNHQFLVMTVRVLRSILASRVLLDIRAQTGDKLVRSDGLTELNTDHLRAGNAQPSCLESIRFATTKRSSL